LLSPFLSMGREIKKVWLRDKKIKRVTRGGDDETAQNQMVISNIPGENRYSGIHGVTGDNNHNCGGVLYILILVVESSQSGTQMTGME